MRAPLIKPKTELQEPEEGKQAVGDSKTEGPSASSMSSRGYHSRGVTCGGPGVSKGRARGVDLEARENFSSTNDKAIMCTKFQVSRRGECDGIGGTDIYMKLCAGRQQCWCSIPIVTV